MKPEEIFGVNAGKVWNALNASGKAMTVYQLMKATGLKREDVFGALGWLGREGKIKIIKGKKGVSFKLI